MDNNIITYTYEANNNYYGIEQKPQKMLDKVSDLVRRITETRNELRAKAGVHANIVDALMGSNIHEIKFTMIRKDKTEFKVSSLNEQTIELTLTRLSQGFQMDIANLMERLEEYRRIADALPDTDTLNMGD